MLGGHSHNPKVCYFMDCLVDFDKSDLGESYVPNVPTLFGESGARGRPRSSRPQWQQTVMLLGSNANIRTDFTAVSQGAYGQR